MVNMRKGNLLGRLSIVQTEVRTAKKIVWRDVLTLVDSNGNWLTPCQTFRSNATRKAVKELKESGWELI